MSPIYAIWRDPVLCYNVVFVASLAASAWAMWWYLRQLLDDRLGPLVGGLVWGFCAYRFSHVLHLQLQALYFLPLAFGALHRVVARRRWQDGAWLGLWFGLTAVSSVYYAVIGLVALGLGGLALVAGAGRVSLGRLLAPLAVGGLVSAALVAPVLVPYVQAQQREGFVRTMDEASRHAATFASFVSEPPWRPVPLAPVGRTEEDGLLPGWGALALAMLSIAALTRSRRQPLLWTWGVVAAAGVVFALGPEGIRSVYALAHRWVFGFQAVRAPARFGVLISFGVAAAAGFAVTWWRRELRPALHPVVLVLSVVVAIEAAGLARAVRSGADIRDCLSVPGCAMRMALAPSRSFRSRRIGPRRRSCSDTLTHGRPLVNGYSGQRPAFAGAVAGALAHVSVVRRDLDAARSRRPFRRRRPTDGLEQAWPLARRASCRRSRWPAGGHL